MGKSERLRAAVGSDMGLNRPRVKMPVLANVHSTSECLERKPASQRPDSLPAIPPPTILRSDSGSVLSYQPDRCRGLLLDTAKNFFEHDEKVDGLAAAETCPSRLTRHRSSIERLLADLPESPMKRLKRSVKATLDSIPSVPPIKSGLSSDMAAHLQLNTDPEAHLPTPSSPALGAPVAVLSAPIAAATPLPDRTSRAALTTASTRSSDRPRRRSSPRLSVLQPCEARENKSSYVESNEASKFEVQQVLRPQLSDSHALGQVVKRVDSAIEFYDELGALAIRHKLLKGTLFQSLLSEDGAIQLSRQLKLSAEEWTSMQRRAGDMRALLRIKIADCNDLHSARRELLRCKAFFSKLIRRAEFQCVDMHYTSTQF